MQNQNWMYFMLGALAIGFFMMFIMNYGLMSKAIETSEGKSQVEKTIALQESYPNYYYYPYSYFYMPWWRSSYNWPYSGLDYIYDYPYYDSWSYPSYTSISYKLGSGRRGRRGSSRRGSPKRRRSASRGRRGGRSASRGRRRGRSASRGKRR